jgi:hypothetical protein
MHDPASEERLLANIKARLPELEASMDRARSHWEYEDYIYRYYHHSFKVFGVQRMTQTIVAALQELLPDHELNPDFLKRARRGLWSRRSFTHGLSARAMRRSLPI